MESKLYNPAGQPKDWLINNFVARTQVFSKIFKDLLTGKMKYPEQHYVIQGQRGMGKTTLLLRLKYEIENTAELNKWLVPVFFNEESYDLTSLSNLWEKLLKYLDSLWETGGDYYHKTDAFVGTADYEKKCFELLISILKDEKKKLVIFFDNFGQLFLDNLKEREQHRFREILMNCNDIRIIGASAVVLQDLHDYSKPFFEFFRVINLDGLNKDETFQLISKLQENSDLKIDIEKNRAKIETLAILTGGVIRTIMLIYEVILADEDGTALRDLETILDRITPLYKHRMEDLPPQQRKIIDVIAKKWDAISTKEIAENIREDGTPMATKLISAQLQLLEKNNVIEKKQTNTKNHLYQLKERFFNIWYLMRNGDRFDRCRVMWLTKFLESWYSESADIEQFIKRHIELLKSGKYYPGTALMIAEALTNSPKVDFENQASLIVATADILNEEQKKLLPKISLKKFETAIKLSDEGKYNESIKVLESIEQTSDQANTLLFSNYRSLNASQKAIAVINNTNKLKPLLSGLAYLDLGNIKKAVKSLETALAANYDFLNFDKGRLANMLGAVYELNLKDLNKAIIFYELSIEFGFGDSYQNLINIFLKQNDFINCEKYFLKAINLGKVDFEKKLIEFYIFIAIEPLKAIALLDKGLKNDPNNSDYRFYQAMIALYNSEFERAEILLASVKESLRNNERFLQYKSAVMTLSSIYVNNCDKSKALSIVEEIDTQTKSLGYLLKSIIYVWDNQFNKAFDYIGQYLEKNANSSKVEYEASAELLFLLLLAKKQYHFTLKLFENQSLNFKDKFKPIYYALMQYLKDEYPNEHLKMGEELQQPVNDIIEKVQQMAIDYA